MNTLFYGWAVLAMVICASAVVGTFAWLHGRNYGRHEVMEKDRLERKRRKLIDTQANIGRRIANALRANWTHQFNVVGFDVVNGDKVVFRIAITHDQEGVKETLLAVNVNAFARAGNGEIVLERSGMSPFYYSTNEGSIHAVIKEASQFLREVA